MVSRAGELLAAGTEGWWNGPGSQWCFLQNSSWGWPWGSTSPLLLEESSPKASAVVETALQPWLISVYNPPLRVTFLVSFRGEFVSKGLRILINGIIPSNMDGLESRLP